MFILRYTLIAIILLVMGIVPSLGVFLGPVAGLYGFWLLTGLIPDDCW